LRTQGLVNTNFSLNFNLDRKYRQLSVTIILGIFLFSCSGGQNFSEFPGFAEHFTEYAPTPNKPNPSEITLLEKYQPRVYAAKGQPGPIDFYKDYIAHGELFLDGKKISSSVDSSLLNQYRDNTNALFKYSGDYRLQGTPTVYARIDYESTAYQNKQYDFTFLTYNMVFPVSGILKGLGKLQSAGLAIAGNLDDWHQLDHYVNVSVALYNAKPVAMVLQQHNYQTTYLIEPESSANTPAISVDIAMRSNELYPHSAERQKHPAVSFISTDNLEFIVDNTNKPMMAGYDVTHGEQEISYRLEFLPQTDAFYQFKGSLGKNRLLPGRSGPPGADYTTLPGLMPRHIRLITGYRTESAEDEIDLFGKLFDRENFAIRPKALEAYKERFFALLN